MCTVNGGCIVEHELFTGVKQSIVLQITMTTPAKREAKIIELLSAIKPPKVHGHHIRRFGEFKKKRKINLDKHKIPKNIREHHEGFMNKQVLKHRKRVLHSLKTDEQREKKKEKKQKKSLVREYLDRHMGIPDARVLSKEEKANVYKEAAKQVDWAAWLEKYRNEPEPNFHETI